MLLGPGESVSICKICLDMSRTERVFATEFTTKTLFEIVCPNKLKQNKKVKIRNDVAFLKIILLLNFD
jgi:hypothetical protein